MSESISPLLPAVGEVFLDIERACWTGAGDTYKGNGTEISIVDHPASP
jgi:hypothetical protein